MEGAEVTNAYRIAIFELLERLFGKNEYSKAWNGFDE